MWLYAIKLISAAFKVVVVCLAWFSFCPLVIMASRKSQALLILTSLGEKGLDVKATDPPAILLIKYSDNGKIARMRTRLSSSRIKRMASNGSKLTGLPSPKCNWEE